MTSQNKQNDSATKETNDCEWERLRKCPHIEGDFICYDVIRSGNCPSGWQITGGN